MSVITSLNVQEKDKKRCNVFVDGIFSFAVNIEIAVKYGLKKGDELDEKVKTEILVEDGKSYAVSLGLKYVSKSLKTKRQVKDYLLKKGFDEKTSYYAIDKLKEYGLINDEEYAKRFIEYRSHLEGKRLSDYKLMMKGIKKEDIAAAREEFNDNSKESALKIAEKRLKNKEINFDNLTKTYRYLIGKGFSYEDAEYCVNFLKKGLEEE